MRYLLFLIVFQFFISSIFAQNCFNKNIQEGKKNYEAGDYYKAKECFERSKKCPDYKTSTIPHDWIKKCDIQIKKEEKNFNTFTETVNGVSFEMVAVRGGTFTMGCTEEQGNDCDADEKPAHKVVLSNYFIGKYEVTQLLWKTVMGENPSFFSGCDMCPIENVSWNDIQLFLSKLNEITGKEYRLPTEAEWEFAARGGINNLESPKKYSGSSSIVKVADYEGLSSKAPKKVGSYMANELGLYDMSGNVYEWCSDKYGAYTNIAVSNPKGPNNGNYFVVRGGSWSNNGLHSRVSNRESAIPSKRSNCFGFRLVLNQ